MKWRKVLALIGKILLAVSAGFGGAAINGSM